LQGLLRETQERRQPLKKLLTGDWRLETKAKATAVCFKSLVSGLWSWASAQKISHPFNGLGHTRQGGSHRVPLSQIIHTDRGITAPIPDLERRDLAHRKFPKNFFSHVIPPLYGRLLG
jgi:hypothetical protein